MDVFCTLEHSDKICVDGGRRKRLCCQMKDLQSLDLDTGQRRRLLVLCLKGLLLLYPGLGLLIEGCVRRLFCRHGCCWLWQYRRISCWRGCGWEAGDLAIRLWHTMLL